MFNECQGHYRRVNLVNNSFIYFNKLYYNIKHLLPKITRCVLLTTTGYFVAKNPYFLRYTIEIQALSSLDRKKILINNITYQSYLSFFSAVIYKKNLSLKVKIYIVLCTRKEMKNWFCNLATKLLGDQSAYLFEKVLQEQTFSAKASFWQILASWHYAISVQDYVK